MRSFAIGVSGLLISTASLVQPDAIPPPPDWSHYTETVRETLGHGVALLSEGDFEFAMGHFRGVQPRKPSHVFINVSGAPPMFRGRCYRATLEAMSQWNEATGDLVQFVETDREALAETVIQFEYDVADREAGQVRYVCGKCMPMAPHDGKRIERSAVIRVAVYGDGEQRPPHSTASLVHIVGHELGHTLGLGESPDKSDLMGPDEHGGSPSTRATAEDLRRLRDLVELSRQLETFAERKAKLPLPKAWETSRRNPSAKDKKGAQR